MAEQSAVLAPPDRRTVAVPPRRRGHGHPWLTLLAVAFGVMMVGLDATVVAIANPAIARDLHADLADLQWVTNGYLLALAVSLIIAGRDRKSTRLNSSHPSISYAVFCLKKKNHIITDKRDIEKKIIATKLDQNLSNC